MNGDYNKGLTGKLNSNENFTCQYRIDSGEKTNGTGDNGGNKNTYFRQISLTDPFPKNRKIGENWSGNVLHDLSNINESKVSAYITDKGNDVYSEEPMYQITLDASLISEIKKYNKSQNNKGEYYSWDGMQSKVWNELDSTSNFIDKFKDYIKFGPNLNRDTKVGDFK